jgi:uncharacterized membrane protein YphA (DoxX/SURF4 family)
MPNIRAIMADIIYGNRATLVLRLVLGALLIFSGIFKVIDPENFHATVARYDILPETIVPYAVLLIPYLEVILGLFLAFGYKVQASSFISIVLFIAYIVLISVSLARGNTFDCGCFELNRFGLNIDETIGIKVIIRDIMILAAFIVLFKADRHLFSIENFLENLRLKDME